MSGLLIRGKPFLMTQSDGLMKENIYTFPALVVAEPFQVGRHVSYLYSLLPVGVGTPVGTGIFNKNGQQCIDLGKSPCTA